MPTEPKMKEGPVGSFICHICKKTVIGRGSFVCPCTKAPKDDRVRGVKP